MASKINRKFVFVVGGFSVAAVLLLVAVVLVNQLYIKNAERHIRSGDELMAQGKLREAYGMYGRALAKKPDVVRYVEKMEEALGKVVADTPTQAVEDYRNMTALKRARTRAQPGDPEQWRILITALEAEAELYSRGDGWLSLESIGKEMKDIMPPGSDGMKLAEETMLYARAQRGQVLSAGERSDLERQLDAFVKTAPKSWRGWSALVELRGADVLRLRSSGQEQAAQRRVEQLDRTIGEMSAAVDPSDPLAQDAVALVTLDRMLLDARVGTRIDRSKLDSAKVSAACDALAAAAVRTGNGSAVRSAVSKLLEAKGADEANKLLDGWLQSNPTDMISAGLSLELASKLGDPKTGFDRTQAAARRILDAPSLSTSLASSIQPETRARALQVIVEAAIVKVASGVDAEEQAKLTAQIADLRGKLLAALQNDDSAPGMIATDAKIAQSKGDLPGAAKKWQLYFTKVPQPPADSYLWSTMVSRAQGDLGFALQTVTKGTDSYPSDLRLVIQRAEIATQLGRFAEAAALYEALSKALPDQEQYARMAVETRSRAEGRGASAAPEVQQLQTALEAKDYPKAREISAAWIKSSNGSMQAMYSAVLIEQQAGDKERTLEALRVAQEKFPTNPDLARIEALLKTEDPLERVDMMVNRMVTDPKQRPVERLRALRSVRTDLARQIAELKQSKSPELGRSEEFLKKLDAAIPEAEKQALASGADDPGTIELAFMEAIGRGDVAAAELHLAAAARVTAVSPVLEVILRARLLDYQGRPAEAIALLEKARQSGRTDAPLASQLAMIQERVGNEPAALALWKEAYDRRPNDLGNVRGYARALGRSGQGRNALDMLRAAVAANPGDIEALRAAADYEAVYGSRTTAIEHRQRLAQLDPTNRENLSDLYALLYQPADFGSVRDAQGRPRFDARTWASVPVDEQRRLLEDAHQMNMALAEQLYTAAIKAAPYDVRFAGRKASVLRELGKYDEGTRAIAEVVKAAEAAGTATALTYTEQGLYLDALGDRAGAEACFEKARKLQDPAKREVDLVLLELEAKRGNAKRAIELLRGVMGEAPSTQMLLRLADLQLVDHQYPEARSTIEKLRTSLGASPSAESQRQLEMLASGLAAGEADQLRDAGKRDEANVKAEEALAALGRAELASPSDLFAPLRRVQILRGMAIATQNNAKLDQAIAEADRVLARNAMYWPMVSQRTDLALDKRDIKAAIGIVERYLQAQPASEEARARLIEMQIASGNVPRAIEVAKTGIEFRPQDPVSAERLGTLYMNTGDAASAAKEFERAFTLDPKSLVYLEKSANARMMAGNPQEALALLRSASDLVARSPVLRAIGAVALSKTGKRDEAMVAGRDALAAARALTENQAENVERAAVILREMFPADRPADFESFMVQSGTPSPVEGAIIADNWMRSGPSGGDKALEWCSKVEAAGDAASVGARAATAMTRGSVLYARGDLQAACESFEKAADMSQRNAAALNNAAYLLVKVKNDTARSFELASRAVQLAPAQPDYLDTLGYILFKSGKLAEAEDVLNKSVAVAPTASALLHLAQVRAGQGNVGDARQLLDRARAKTPDADTGKEIEEFSASLKGK